MQKSSLDYFVITLILFTLFTKIIYYRPDKYCIAKQLRKSGINPNRKGMDVL